MRLCPFVLCVSALDELKSSIATPDKCKVTFGIFRVVGRLAWRSVGLGSRSNVPGHKLDPNRFTTEARSSQNRFQREPMGAHGHPKIEPKTVPERAHGGPWAPMGRHGLPKPIWAPFLAQFGAILGSQLGSCWGHVDLRN